MGAFSKSIRCIVILLLLLCAGCHSQQRSSPEEQDVRTLRAEGQGASKHVILLVVDSLQSKALETGVKQGKLPAFESLIERGRYVPDFVSSFPTMSVTIDSTLLTGTHPDEHHVPGLVWYSAEEKRLVSYGTGGVETVRYGFDAVMRNALLQLNGRHLSPDTPTMFEELADMGLTSGSINGLVFRGKTKHTLTLPPWLHPVSSMPEEIDVHGPDFMTYGALSDPLEGIAELPDGLADRMGLNDRYAVEAATHLIRNNLLPAFLYVYLPDLDRRLHNKGPSDLGGLEDTDRRLGKLLQAIADRERRLRRRDTVVIVMGDSGVTQMLPRSADPSVRLRDLLRDFRLLQPGESVNEDTDLVLALNESMAYVYSLKPEYALHTIANALVADDRIDFAAWKENEWIRVVQGGMGRELQYKADGQLIDPYGQSWTVRGDAEVLGLQLDGNAVRYTDYPDALKRLSAALHSHAGEFLVVTTKPGYDMTFGGSPTHPGGGGHGSLHKTDSLFPVIISGTDETPDHRRIVDLKAFLMKLLRP